MEALDYKPFLKRFPSRIQDLIVEYIKQYQINIWDYCTELDNNEKNKYLLSELMTALCYYTMETTRIAYVVYHGQKYYGGDECGDMSDSDSDSNDEDDDRCAPDITPTWRETVDYHLIHKSYNTGWRDEEYDPKIQSLIQKLQNVSIDQITITGPTYLVLNNRRGIHADHRGSNHCRVKLPFYSTRIVKLPCKLLDFMKAWYHIKSHKWDTWYEMFSGATAEINGDIITVSYHGC